MGRLSRGLVQVYTGEGKGKTTAALGLALRAVGQGLRVCFVQFMKGGLDLGERKAAARLVPALEVHWFSAAQWGDPRKAPPGTPWWLLSPSDQDRDRAQEGVAFARRALAGGYDLVVLDEILQALCRELVSLEQLLELIRTKPAQVELVMTGRGAPEEIIRAADLVTEMRAVKHPYESGVSARKGIEY
jgi:cob(I)alamin adenosyltransferase